MVPVLTLHEARRHGDSQQPQAPATGNLPPLAIFVRHWPISHSPLLPPPCQCTPYLHRCSFCSQFSFPVSSLTREAITVNAIQLLSETRPLLTRHTTSQHQPSHFTSNFPNCPSIFRDCHQSFTNYFTIYLIRRLPAEAATLRHLSFFAHTSPHLNYTRYTEYLPLPTRCPIYLPRSILGSYHYIVTYDRLIEPTLVFATSGLSTVSRALHLY